MDDSARRFPRSAAQAVGLFLLWAFFALPVVATDSESDRAEPVLSESVTVTATRLAQQPAPAEKVPAGVTVIDRGRIERSGATTLQDLIGLETGAIVYDQVGNDVEKQLDLRGFSQATGTRVFLDGAPVNDTRNNSLALELIPLSALERVEITRGSVASLAGGGSEAGVIRLVTRKGGGFGGSISIAAGSDETARWAGSVGGGTERVDFHLSASHEESDGFRRNAGGDLDRFSGSIGADLGGGKRLELVVVDGRSDLGNPGALTEQEIEEDPRAAPYNELDYSEQRLTQAALNFRAPLGGSLFLSANAFVRERDSDILSTGRSASLFGGFFLDSDASSFGATAQISHDRRYGAASNRVTAGVEWLDGETDALGYLTPPDDPGEVILADPASANTTGRQTLSFYLQNLWSPRPDWSFLAEIRTDTDRVDYRDALSPDLDDSKRFSEVSVRTGATWNLAESHGLFVSYGEGFLPPTVEELFSFPLFFSNPDLQPEDSRSYEIGYRGRWAGRAQLDVALFRIDTEDEIVFVPDPPPAQFTGSNRNVGESRREGAELSLRGSANRRLRWFANLTWMEAEFRDESNRGSAIPMVPEQRFAAGFDLDLPRRFTIRIDGLHVGEQVLDNDAGNTQPRLDDYSLVNARLTWMPGEAAGLRLIAEARNLLDEQYATRGIYAGEVFLTPAPGRRYLTGAEWVW